MGTSKEQGKLWSEKARDWTELFEPMSKPIWLKMLGSVKIVEGTRFVDLGCGGGGASVLAHEMGARVSGLDASEALIEIASERVPAGEFRVGDLEDLPFGDDSFDVSFASMSVMFADDPSIAVKEMKRCTIPGGYVTVSTWGSPEHCEYQAVLKAAASVRSSPPSGSGPFALSGRGVLEELMEMAELRVVDSGEVDGPFRFEGFDMMWKMVASAGPIRSAIKKAGEDNLKAAIMKAARPFQKDNGEFFFSNRFRYVTALV